MDYDSLCRKRESLKRDQSAVNAEISRLQDKLRILDDAYKRLKDEKTRFGRVRTVASDAQKRVSYWRGNNNLAFTGGCDEMLADYDAVHGQIDRILDNINWKRNDLNRQIASKQSILKGILSNLNFIKTQLENWTN